MMQQEYKVYPDKIRDGLSVLVYVAFIAAMAAILIFYKPNLFISMVVILLTVLMGVMTAQIVKKMYRNRLMYCFNGQGITDYTNEKNILFLSWQDIAKIEMLSNYSSLQIGILGSKVMEEKEAVSQNVKENLMKNGNMVFYNIIIDGFLFRKKQFREIFHQLVEFAQIYNTSIEIRDYIDPLARKKKA